MANTFDVLRKHYPEKEYALMSEVRDAAGFNASRSADFMVMNLWPSRCLSLTGIELKSFRGDWIKEMKSPEKADVIFKYCDYWWLLTTQEGIANINEIPDQWGWMRIHNGKIKIIKEAPRLTPCVMDRSFLAAIIKRAVNKDGFIAQHSINDRIELAKESGRNERRHEFDRIKEHYDALNENVQKFKEITGIEIHEGRWARNDINKIGEAVKFITDGGSNKLKSDLLKLEDTCELLHKQIKKGLASLKQTELL